MSNKKVELLAPAGNMDKLKTAFHFGADAVYLGGKDFSLRAFAENFSEDELTEAVAYAHKLRKKIYVTVNIFPRNEDFKKIIKYVKFLDAIGVDAVLVTDAGLIMQIKALGLKLDIHLSTQANTLNKHTVKFWAQQGVKRIVLARELSFEEIQEIRKHNEDTEIEIFIHGAMCISYSGRCLLSNYLADRDANKGECIQACRWKYKLKEGETHKIGFLESAKEKDLLIIEEDAQGTYILNSRDLNLLEHIDTLAPYVDSFKIEGRMKSEYYLATVIGVYRRALDEYYEHGSIADKQSYLNDLKKVVHRHYTEAYLGGDNDSTVDYSGKQEGHDWVFVGIIREVLGESEYIVEMRNRFKKGDTLEALSAGMHNNKRFEVGIMEDEEGVEIEDAKLVQQRLRINIPFSLLEGDMLRKSR